MENSKKPEYLVGIGASAGGLEALQDFFNNMPAVHDLAFVVIQHLSPDFKSLMNQLLSNFTKLKIQVVENKMLIEKDTIYLIPPKNNMIVENGTLYLSEQERGHVLNLPIDIFFKSMAKDFLNKSIAVVLSGTGSDGSAGILEVGGVGGLVIAQNPDSAQFDGMPRSAINTQVVNKVLDANLIPAFISDYLKNPIIQATELEKDEYKKSGDTYGQIFSLLAKKKKVDFSDYKESTMYRRIDRRAKTLLISSIEEYAQRLFNDDTEIECLFNDLLIGVTSFFRDHEAFEALESEHIPALFQQRIDTQQLRVWIAACSTGEEAYSFAILLKEYSEKLKKAFDIKIFASDISRSYLSIANQGCFTEASLVNVSQQRKDQFFLKKGDRYYIVPEIRNMIVFAPQNLVVDPPFTNIDLISCRNFLIYIKPEAQQRIISSFHFSLNKGGILFLGSSEGTGDLSSSFSEEDRTWKIYKKMTDGRMPFYVGPRKQTTSRSIIEHLDQKRSFKGPRILKQKIYDLLLEQYLEDSIVIDVEEEILHTTGKANVFLNLQSGRMSSNIIRLIHEDLRSVITSGIHRVQTERRNVVYKKNIVMMDGQEINVDIAINPLYLAQDEIGFFVLKFENFYERKKEEATTAVYEINSQANQLIHDLEFQIQTTKESLQSALEEAETTNEELQSTNEELLASNEELQSTNEELHAVNEELYTVNSEHQKKIGELESLEEDINNIAHATEVGTIFLDENLCIRKITPTVSETYNILPYDVGRSVETFALPFLNENFIKKVREVQKSKTVQYVESGNDSEKSILIKILPYSGAKKNRGIVISMLDMTLQKNTEIKLNVKTRELEEATKQLSDFAHLTAKDINNIFERLEKEIKDLKCPLNAEVPVNCKITQLSPRLAALSLHANALRQFSELRRENLRLTSVNLNELVKDVCSEFKSHETSVIFDQPIDLPTVSCDQDIIRNVFVALIGNALKFNVSSQKKVKIGYCHSEEQHIFSVHDNGIGISEDQFFQIFKIFSGLNRKGLSSEGQGVGLALAKRGLELQKGKIWVESEVDVGSTFYFSLPDNSIESGGVEYRIK